MQRLLTLVIVALVAVLAMPAQAASVDPTLAIAPKGDRVGPSASVTVQIAVAHPIKPSDLDLTITIDPALTLASYAATGASCTATAQVITCAVPATTPEATVVLIATSPAAPQCAPFGIRAHAVTQGATRDARADVASRSCVYLPLVRR